MIRFHWTPTSSRTINEAFADAIAESELVSAHLYTVSAMHGRTTEQDISRFEDGFRNTRCSTASMPRHKQHIAEIDVPPTKKRDTGCTGLFDLPREIRDQIYSDMVTCFMCKPGERPCHECRKRITSADGEGTLAIDHRSCCLEWLASMSAISLQFAAELQPIWYGSWTFYMTPHRDASQWEDTADAGNFDRLALLFRALGPNLQDIRKVSIGKQKYGFGIDVPRANHIQTALENLRGMHKDLTLEISLCSHYTEVFSRLDFICWVRDGRFVMESEP